MIKNKWFFVAGILFILSGVLNLINNNFYQGLLLIFVGVVNFLLSTMIFPNKNDKKIDIATVAEDSAFNTLIKEGKKIPAIKRIRVLSKCSLFEAERFVDSMMKNY